MWAREKENKQTNKPTQKFHVVKTAMNKNKERGSGMTRQEQGAVLDDTVWKVLPEEVM